jgi:hypothetical protein
MSTNSRRAVGATMPWFKKVILRDIMSRVITLRGTLESYLQVIISKLFLKKHRFNPEPPLPRNSDREDNTNTIPIPGN